MKFKILSKQKQKQYKQYKANKSDVYVFKSLLLSWKLHSWYSANLKTVNVPVVDSELSEVSLLNVISKC